MTATDTAPALGTSPEQEALTRIRQRLLRAMPRDTWWGWGLPLLIAVVAGVMRFWHLGRPHALVFDETYYAHDSYDLLHYGVEMDSGSHDTQPGFIVHPPLAKWMMAAGQAMFGHNAFGWRFSAAVVGTLCVLMIARIARRMFRSTALGCVAGLLMTFDALEFVQSRMAMLDIFLMFWVLAALGCLVLDRDQGRRRLAAALTRPIQPGEWGPWLGLRPWRIACGICLGAAAASKWSGVFWIPVFLLIAVVWDGGARRIAGATWAFPRAAGIDGVYAIVPFVVVPLAVYTATWTGWFLSDVHHAYDHDRYVHPGQSWFTHGRAVLGGWLKYHWEMYHFHANLSAGHPYLSHPWGWLLLTRPVAYFYAAPKGCGAASCSQEVLGVGTPAIWWLSIPALVVTLFAWAGRRDWRAAVIFLGFLASYLPWFREDAHHRTMFLFYALPSVPFMVLALTMGIGMVLGRARNSDVRRAVGGAVTGLYLVAVIWNFGYLYPVLSGQVITYDQWKHRMLFTECNAQPHRNDKVENAPCWI